MAPSGTKEASLFVLSHIGQRRQQWDTGKTSGLSHLRMVLMAIHSFGFVFIFGFFSVLFLFFPLLSFVTMLCVCWHRQPVVPYFLSLSSRYACLYVTSMYMRNCVTAHLLTYRISHRGCFTILYPSSIRSSSYEADPTQIVLPMSCHSCPQKKKITLAHSFNSRK